MKIRVMPFEPSPDSLGILPEAEPIEIAPDTTGAFRATVVFEDAQTEFWAKEVCQQVKGLAGDESVVCTARNLAEFTEPEVFAQAVSDATQSDLIVVCIHADEELPVLLHQWVAAWLPCRPRQPGALVALLGLSGISGRTPDPARQYLRAVAEWGRLDLIADERQLVAESTTAFMEQGLPTVSPATRPFNGQSEGFPSAFYMDHWGINE